MSVGQANQRSQLFHAFGTISTGTTVIAAFGGAAPANPLANTRISIYRAVFTFAAAGTLAITDTTTAALGPTMSLAVGATIFLHPVNGDPWWASVNPGAGIILTPSVAMSYDLYWLNQV